MGKNENNLIFAKTIAVYDLKVGTCIELNDLLNLSIKDQGHSLTVPNGYLVFKVKSFFLRNCSVI